LGERSSVEEPERSTRGETTGGEIRSGVGEAVKSNVVSALLSKGARATTRLSGKLRAGRVGEDAVS
jgi:hypothetical protein